MRKSNRFVYTGRGANSNVLKGGSGQKSKGCKTLMKPPYMRSDFWNNPLNQFWENALYSEESKQYFRETLLT